MNRFINIHKFVGYLALIITVTACECHNKIAIIDVKVIDNKSISDIVHITDSIVEPILYHKMVIDTTLDHAKQKQLFIDQILPSILIAKYFIGKRLERVQDLVQQLSDKKAISSEDQRFLDSLFILYRAESLENLIVRIKPHATSLVLAQAALESGWGASRLAEEGNNFFGMGTTRSDTSSIRSILPDRSQVIYMKKYNTMVESVEHYFLNIARHKAYKSFRNKRNEEANVFQLVNELRNYSELGSEYAYLLKSILKRNNFELYDSYILKETNMDNCWYNHKQKQYREYIEAFRNKNRSIN
jgi:Bax protein